MTRFLTTLSLATVALMSLAGSSALAQNGAAWKNIYTVEKQFQGTQWVYQIRVNGSWRTVATASSLDMLNRRIIFMANQDQLPAGESRSLQRQIDPNWRYDSQYDNQQAAIARLNEITNANWKARIKTTLRAKPLAEKLELPQDFKIDVPSKPELKRPPGSGPDVPRSNRSRFGQRNRSLTNASQANFGQRNRSRSTIAPDSFTRKKATKTAQKQKPRPRPQSPVRPVLKPKKTRSNSGTP